MTQQEYENKLKELQDELEKLKTAEIADKGKRWKPNQNQAYWAIGVDGQVECVSGYPDAVIEWCYLIGNCFKTKQEAEEYRKQIEYTARYKNYIEEHSEPVNWNKGLAEEKYHATFNFCYNEIVVEWAKNMKEQGAIYASSEQIILDAIKEVGEDNFKKYVFGVK